MSAGKFRKKPVVVEAWRFGGIPSAKENPPPAWIMKAINDAFGGGEKVPGSTLCVGGIVSNFREQYLEIGTLEGIMRANKGDWIIKGVAGELYPCKDAVFQQIYEPVHD